MKVFVPNSSTVAKILGKTLLALVLSLNAHAFQQGQGQAQEQQKAEKKADKCCDKTPAPKDCGQSASHAQSGSSSQSSAQSASQAQSSAQSQAQAKDCGKSAPAKAQCDSTQVAAKKSSDCGCTRNAPKWGSRYNSASCGNRSGGLNVGPMTQVNGWYLQTYDAHGVKRAKRDWRGSTWENTQIDHVDLKKVNAENTVWTDTTFFGDLTHVKFNESKFNWVTMGGNLRDVDFKSSSLNNVLFQNADFSSKHGKRSNFDGATLDNVRFQGGNLSGMTFKNAHLKDVTFDCATIKHSSIFDGAYIYSYRAKQYLEIKGDFLRRLESMLGDVNSYTISSSDFFADVNGTL